MPIYEYNCNSCSAGFEKLVCGKNPEAICPMCGSKETKKRLSRFGMGRSASAVSSGESSGGSGCSGCSSSNCSSCG